MNEGGLFLRVESESEDFSMYFYIAQEITNAVLSLVWERHYKTFCDGDKNSALQLRPLFGIERIKPILWDFCDQIWWYLCVIWSQNWLNMVTN